MQAPDSPDPIVIVGTGFSGLCLAIRLKRAGIDDFVILERAGDIGGTWRDNRYPGAACDIESHLYSFSFAPNPDWSRAFSGQEEILGYLRHCVETFGLRSHIRLGCGVASAEFDETSGYWAVETDTGETLRARVLVSACGGLSRPAYPLIEGLATFEGKTFHSARWEPSFALEGKSIAVIGTGASAVQIVPAIAPAVASLVVYQRAAPWILPKKDRSIRPIERAMFAALPLAQQLARTATYWRREALAVGFVVDPDFLKIGETVSRAFLAKSVADPVLRAKLTPDYRMGCKRILPSSDYYPAVQRHNVEVVTDPIAAIRPRAVVTRDGTERAADALLLCTGFQAAENAAPFELRGYGARRLHDVWGCEGAEAYLGTAVSGFPNLFLMVGPNTGVGHNSLVTMIEWQAHYILSSILTMRQRAWKVIDVREAAQTRYNARLQARMRNTVWATGCRSWYHTRSGKNTTLWPGFTFEFRQKTRRFVADDYNVAPKDDGT